MKWVHNLVQIVVLACQEILLLRIKRGLFLSSFPIKIF
jgi:hypothetical protein